MTCEERSLKFAPCQTRIYKSGESAPGSPLLPPVGEDDEADGVADQPEHGEHGGQDPRDYPPAVQML